MAVKYCRSGAAGAGTGADWTNAYTTLVLAIAGSSAGDTIYVADDHAETQASAMTITSPGTAGALLRIICVNTHTVEPPTAVGTTATVTTTGSFNMSFTSGYAYVYGITFNVTTGASSFATVIASGTANNWIFDTCTFKNLSTSSASMKIGVAGFTAYERCEFINCSVGFNSTSSRIAVSGIFLWRGGSIINSGQIPTTLFIVDQTIPGIAEISDVDMSLLGSGKNLITASVATPTLYYLRNCKLGASVSVITGTIGGQGGVSVFLDNCDSGNTNYRMEHYKYQGKILQETTIVRTSGASDGTTPISHKFTSLTTGPTLFSPLDGPWFAIWNDSTGSKTVTVQFMHDSVTNLTNADIYLEVEYLGTASLPLGVLTSSRVADIFAAAVDCTAGGATWTTTGLTNPNSQKLTLTFTAQIKGLIRARVCLIKTNYTVYVDPLLVVT